MDEQRGVEREALGTARRAARVQEPVVGPAGALVQPVSAQIVRSLSV
jgi:hypothetical protein